MDRTLKGNVEYKTFRGTFASWDQLFSSAAEFASQLDPNRIISISHSADHSDGLVVVWYFSESSPTVRTGL